MSSTRIFTFLRKLRAERLLLCALINRLQHVSGPVSWRTFVVRGVQISAAFTSLSTRNHNQRQKMAEFVGKYKLVDSQNFDEYMKALGVGLVTRKMANAASPVQEITFSNDEFYIKTSTTFKTTEIKFKLNTEFDETTGDGRQVKSTITRDGNKLIQKQGGEKPSLITREFNGDEMKMTLTLDDIVCTRIYKKFE